MGDERVVKGDEEGTEDRGRQREAESDEGEEGDGDQGEADQGREESHNRVGDSVGEIVPASETIESKECSETGPRWKANISDKRDVVGSVRRRGSNPTSICALALKEPSSLSDILEVEFPVKPSNKRGEGDEQLGEWGMDVHEE